jgi:hypothetical protein
MQAWAAAGDGGSTALLETDVVQQLEITAHLRDQVLNQ